jgi:hypothetical protein
MVAPSTLGANTLPSNASRESNYPFVRPWGPRQQDHGSLNARILGNPHAKQKWNEKKALDQMKKKVKLERDELQAQV